jgi:hypothetical protein
MVAASRYLAYPVTLSWFATAKMLKGQFYALPPRSGTRSWAGFKWENSIECDDPVPVPDTSAPSVGAVSRRRLPLCPVAGWQEDRGAILVGALVSLSARDAKNGLVAAHARPGRAAWSARVGGNARKYLNTGSDGREEARHARSIVGNGRS